MKTRNPFATCVALFVALLAPLDLLAQLTTPKIPIPRLTIVQPVDNAVLSPPFSGPAGAFPIVVKPFQTMSAATFHVLLDGREITPAFHWDAAQSAMIAMLSCDELSDGKHTLKADGIVSVQGNPRPAARNVTCYFTIARAAITLSPATVDLDFGQSGTLAVGEQQDLPQAAATVSVSAPPNLRFTGSSPTPAVSLTPTGQPPQVVPVTLPVQGVLAGTGRLTAQVRPACNGHDASADVIVRPVITAPTGLVPIHRKAQLAVAGLGFVAGATTIALENSAHARTIIGRTLDPTNAFVLCTIPPDQTPGTYTLLATVNGADSRTGPAVTVLPPDSVQVTPASLTLDVAGGPQAAQQIQLWNKSDQLVALNVTSSDASRVTASIGPLFTLDPQQILNAQLNGGTVIGPATVMFGSTDTSADVAPIPPLQVMVRPVITDVTAVIGPEGTQDKGYVYHFTITGLGFIPKCLVRITRNNVGIYNGVSLLSSTQIQVNVAGGSYAAPNNPFAQGATYSVVVTLHSNPGMPNDHEVVSSAPVSKVLYP